MSQELDRRIAVEVMGEPEPEPIPFGAARMMQYHLMERRSEYKHSGKENWVWSPVGEFWQPLPFSTDLDLAMRAVEVYVEEWKHRYPGWRHYPHEAVLYMDRSFDAMSKLPYRVAFGSEYAFGPTLPEAICNLLLNLKEKG